MLIEFKTRTAGASRVFVNPAQIVAVYVRADGCYIVTTERSDSGRNVHLLIEEPVNRVLAKLGVDGTVVPSGVPAGGPQGYGAAPVRPARDPDGPTRAGPRAGAGTVFSVSGPFAGGPPLPGEGYRAAGPPGRASTTVD